MHILEYSLVPYFSVGRNLRNTEYFHVYASFNVITFLLSFVYAWRHTSHGGEARTCEALPESRGVSNHQQLYCLLNHFCRRTPKNIKASRYCHIVRGSPGDRGVFPCHRKTTKNYKSTAILGVNFTCYWVQNRKFSNWRVIVNISMIYW